MLAAACSREPLPAGGDEGRIVTHDVVGGERKHGSILLAGQREGGASRNRRSAIAPHRLEQHVGLDADLGELLQHHEAIGGVGNDDRPREQRGIGDAYERVLEGRARAKQRQELLRPHLARGRPQPRSGTATHDQGNDSFCHRRSNPVVLAIPRNEAGPQSGGGASLGDSMQKEGWAVSLADEAPRFALAALGLW